MPDQQPLPDPDLISPAALNPPRRLLVPARRQVLQIAPVIAVWPEDPAPGVLPVVRPVPIRRKTMNQRAKDAATAVANGLIYAAKALFSVRQYLPITAFTASAAVTAHYFWNSGLMTKVAIGSVVALTAATRSNVATAAAIAGATVFLDKKMVLPVVFAMTALKSMIP